VYHYYFIIIIVVCVMIITIMMTTTTTTIDIIILSITLFYEVMVDIINRKINHEYIFLILHRCSAMFAHSHFMAVA